MLCWMIEHLYRIRSTPVGRISHVYWKIVLENVESTTIGITVTEHSNPHPTFHRRSTVNMRMRIKLVHQQIANMFCM